MQTSEGFMDLDWDNMELYKQRGDLLCPIVKLAFVDCFWTAECPDGSAYLIEQQAAQTPGKIVYLVHRIRNMKFSRFVNDTTVIMETKHIGTSEEYEV